ncbi:MAG: hypothetical protein QXW10_00095 [Candidatus Micrarchaeaceae archaeon]
MMDNLKAFYLQNNIFECLFNALSDSALAAIAMVSAMAGIGGRISLAFAATALAAVLAFSFTANLLRPKALPKSAKIILIACFALMLCAIEIVRVV